MGSDVDLTSDEDLDVDLTSDEDLDVHLTSDEESSSGSTIPSDEESHDDNNDDDVDVDDKRKTQIIKPKVDSSSAPILERNDEYAAEEEGARSLSVVDKT